MNFKSEQGRKIDTAVATDVDGRSIQPGSWYVLAAPTRIFDEARVISGPMSEVEAHTRVDVLNDIAAPERENADRLAHHILNFRDDSERTGSVDPSRVHHLLARSCALLERIAGVEAGTAPFDD